MAGLADPCGRESQVVPLAPGPTAEQQAAQQSQTATAALAVQVWADDRVQRMTIDLQVPVYRRSRDGQRI